MNTYSAYVMGHSALQGQNTMNSFTLIIHNKGWTVKEACEYWGIRYETYNRQCNSDKFYNRLECMCNGLEDRLNDD